MEDSLALALVVGLLQGIFEWLPISSEGQITLYLTVVEGLPGVVATRFSLFLHLGTALSATAYYRREVATVVRSIPEWRPTSAVERTPEVTFLAVATLVSGVVGVAAYATVEGAVSTLSGGAFVALVGVLLIATGVLQRTAAGTVGGRETLTLADALLVGAMQGLAVLPGVSRSGSTTGALLLRGHDGPESFRLSFLLSIPAAIGAGALVVADEGIPALAPETALVALAVSALVGYLTIDALMRVVERVAFWGVCVGLGALAVVGGALLLV
ncbi:undecaprenyl-diphosphate phosphatase [Halomarina pelagica]|uniref:undecaprenyl-diphosphate phosphatase n=1 Tax=Halomarina pelagica TaxID=2961599 RepID=UPI0020C3F9BF|nr:undecaprenyl-diphosphate phosphatase [Halomarina sp. BND7]